MWYVIMVELDANPVELVYSSHATREEAESFKRSLHSDGWTFEVTTEEDAARRGLLTPA